MRNRHLVRFVFIAAGIDFCDEKVEIWIWPKRSLRDELLPTSWAFLVARTKRGDDTIRTESMQAFLSRHCFLEHVQTYGTHQFGIQTSRRHCDFRAVSDGFLGCSMQFI